MLLINLLTLGKQVHPLLVRNLVSGLHNAEIERFAVFGRISASLLHEVSNPLTAAVINLDQLDGHDSPLIGEVRNNLRQLERYVAAARQQLQPHTKVRQFSVSEELQQLLLVIQPLARQARVSIVIRLSGVFYLRGDPVRFNQLIANLLANALDAYKEVPNEAPDRHVRLAVWQTGKWLRVTVADSARGIAKDQLSLLFRPFYSTKTQSGRGLGIGLTTVKNIVEQDFDGRITVTSVLGEGTTFSVWLKLPKNAKATPAYSGTRRVPTA